MAEKNKYIDVETDNDFGFTFEDETSIEPVINEVEDLKLRLQAVRKIYLPFLENLAKNSEQPIIKWPDRGPILNKQIAKLKQLTDV